MTTIRNGGEQWWTSVQAAFPDKELCSRIYAEASNEPTRLPALFDDISRYVLYIQQQQPQIQENPTNTKKRKLEDTSSGISTAQQQQNGVNSETVADPVVAFACKDVSVQIPARKKLKVQFLNDAKDDRRRELRLLNSTTEAIECALPVSQVDEVFCLPVPDKQARQTYFAVIPKIGSGGEQVLFTLNDNAPAPSPVSSEEVREDDTYVTLTQRAFENMLAPYGKKLVMPDAAEFASSRPQPHRKGEKGFHVNAHRGSKEGYLHLLSPGLLWGFKKPLAFFPFHCIESISYTSVLQRTFNLVVTVSASDYEAEKDIEFSMLDQEDFAGIDEYIKRHGLNDASMAAQRRAKAYNVNKDKSQHAEVNGDVATGGEQGESELAKAEQQLQDEEDEEEEDYEASGGESDGEGEESGEDEDEDGEGFDDDDAGEDDGDDE
ncbi:hypothetical protein LTR37_019935 [Vermiconidia calcicola]|uniref:Uncharacterized protein n=1 Tax=Vermiconidia calcicola TaxID=1690605 RepID=A0ACC3MES2_9PEZI|nr:hypothetical protein LTR37_019935 [Vermiconidia calcicola]